MPRAGALALLLALLLVPTTSAFSAAEGELYLAFDGERPPALLATGAVTFEGSVGHSLMLAGSSTTRLETIPHLTIVDRAGLGDREVRDATLEVHTGALLWSMPDGVTMPVQVTAPYALTLGLPDAPVPTTDRDPGAGFLLAGEALSGQASWSRGTLELLPFDATITVRDARGTPLEGWASRRVNAGATSQSDPDGLGVIFRAEGAFVSRLGATLVGGAVGAPGDLALHVGPAEEDRMRETAEMLSETTSSFFGGADPFAEVQEPLDVLAQVSGILNGAVMVLPGGVGEGVDTVAPLEARYGDGAFETGALTLFRGEMDVAWEEGEMRVTGEPSVALGRNGFQTDPPATIGLFPLVSLVLWAIAAGAIVYYFVKRPPKGASNLGLRMLSLAFWLVMLVVVFLIWDRSFEATFGMGVVSTVRAQGITPDSLPTLGTLLAFELLPWGIAAILFALPVRIVLGVALRYLGRGKSFKGLATAGGLIALGILGPMYALWCFNLVWSRVAASMGT